MPLKNSTVLATRAPNRTVEEIKGKLNKRKPTLNAWLLWAISLGLRSHTKNERH